jgi:hypothetical protein
MFARHFNVLTFSNPQKPPQSSLLNRENFEFLSAASSAATTFHHHQSFRHVESVKRWKGVREEESFRFQPRFMIKMHIPCACIDVMIKEHFFVLRTRNFLLAPISLLTMSVHLYKCKTYYYYYSRVVHYASGRSEQENLWNFYSSHLLFAKKSL